MGNADRKINLQVTFQELCYLSEAIEVLLENIGSEAKTDLVELSFRLDDTKAKLEGEPEEGY